ncbi:MAG: class I SAM-dependent methyltransferase [Myxococcota bacterium]|nr:class I SAM-dependent methyltransferase [Myxococcota bacterium]
MKPKRLQSLSASELTTLEEKTISHYEQKAEDFWEGTKDHDVSQNREALLRHIQSKSPYRILDFGCGPGRDLAAFLSLGHEAVGLDGCEEFVRMARSHTGCEVFHQSFLHLDLPSANFDGVFANASIFHVPTQELPRVLLEIRDALKPGGVLFCSNPRGPDLEQFTPDRYGAFLCRSTWNEYLRQANFVELEHYFRPPGKPRDEQPWLATVWRKPAN